MKLKLTIAAVLVACFGVVACAQPTAQAQKEHAWLERFVGEWESSMEMSMGPDQPPITSTGTMSAKMLGDFWMIAEINGEVMGTTINAVNTVGFDAKKNHYVGTWVDSMSDHVWYYKGFVDESGKKLTLEAEGPNFMNPEVTTQFRDIYDFQSADHLILTSQMLDDSGNWIQFMRGEIKRKK